MIDVLRSIVARASSIHERLHPDFTPAAEPSNHALIEKRMHAWSLASANGDAALFRRRLDWDGLDENLARRAVSPVQLRLDVPLPRWAVILGEILGHSASDQRVDRSIDPQNPIAFEAMLTPFIGWARSQCERKAGPSYAGFPEIAHVTLERQLLQLLSGHAAPSLRLALKVESVVSPLDLFVQSEPSDERLSSFFLEYSALARTLSSTTELWVAATAELLQRFNADSDAIRLFIECGDELKVASVATSQSGTYDGRSVVIITFVSGQRVVYKPRSLAIEAGWNALIDWLSDLGAPVNFRSFRVLNRADYGWAGYVDHATCKNDNEAREYFTRAGALLCVTHLLCGMDCHGENVIAAGPHPVLIDLETLLSPEIADPQIGADAPRLARKILKDSVLRTYLLPVYAHALRDGTIFDGSGFGADDGCPLHVYDYEAEMVTGFEAMYRFLQCKRETLLAANSPFQALRDMEVRFADRHTAQYSTVLDALRHPNLCRDGVERSLQIERLALARLTSEAIDERPGWREIWNAEREGVERGDVPQFSVIAGGDTISLSKNRSMAGEFERTGHSRAVARLHHFNDADLAFQVDLIRSSLRSRAPARVTADSLTNPPPLGTDEPWLAEAVAIARWLERSAICAPDGSASWLQPAWTHELMLENEKRELDIAGHDLSDGAVGIGLFLAAVDRVEAGFARLAVAAVRPILIELEERGEETAAHLGVGGFSGLGSLVYGLTQMSRLLGDSELLQGAERAANLITNQRIDSARALDVTHGLAGALLGLLSLVEMKAGDSSLAAAIRCGEQLIVRFERTLNRRCPVGFSVGAAGMAYALCRLYSFTGHPNLLNGARALIEFERSCFFAEPVSMAALGRIASLGVIDDEATRMEIDHALAITAEHNAMDADHLCCGNCGRVDILGTASRVLRRPELMDCARSLAWRTIWRSRERGEYRLGVPSAGQLRSPSLFQGLSGIGYTLLRLARPEVLPDVLLLR